MTVQILKMSMQSCMPCKQLSKMIHDLDVLGDVPKEINLTQVDIDEEQELAVKYNVRSVPTMIKLVDGVEVDRKVGVPTKQALIEWFKG